MNFPSRVHGFFPTRHNLFYGLGLAAMLLLTGCGKGAAESGAPPAGGGRGGGKGGGDVPVVTAPVVVKPMTVKVRAVGNVEASSTVDVRSQVSGELLTVNFTEGQDVKEGQLLFTIDPKPFETALKQAEAAYARDNANAKNIEAQRARAENLMKAGLVARADYDALASQAAAIQASLASDSASIDSAKIQLQHTKITAPVGGRTGALLVHPGSLVRNSDTAALVVINQISPAFVSFAVPARLLPRLQSNRRLPVEASPAGATDQKSTGTVTFIDNAVDQNSDSIRVKATFANSDRRLWPGAFVEVTLQLAIDAEAVVVPTAAVQPSQQGQFVFVVKDDQTVEARLIKIAWTEEQEVVVADGLKAGETVVTDGQLRLTPGAKVSTKGGGARKGS